VIAIKSQNGHILRAFHSDSNVAVGFYPREGFVSTDTLQARNKIRTRSGERVQVAMPVCSFRLQDGCPIAVAGCVIHKTGETSWTMSLGAKTFYIGQIDDARPLPLPEVAEFGDSQSLRMIGATLAALFAVVTSLGIFFSDGKPDETAPEQATVVIPNVVVAKPPPTPPQSTAETAPSPPQQSQTSQAVRQRLGFLQIGRKELTKAVGGLPTNVERRSPGAGSGGDRGSGGELLAGIGEGVKHTTVGNSGVAGLGGIGTSGPGGGLGGHGRGYVGGGRAGAGGLSGVKLGDAVELEGGLDQSVVRATITKYLSQVQACYEQGLRKKPDLAGHVSMDFEINASGDVNVATVKQSSLGFPETEGCIAVVIKRWKFPKPVGGTIVKVNYPFTFKPINSI
jgi:hypothetical protein